MDQPQPVIVPASKWFGRILIILIVGWVLIFLVMIAMAIWIPNPTASQSLVEDNVSKAFWAILSAFIGLIGGKFS